MIIFTRQKEHTVCCPRHAHLQRQYYYYSTLDMGKIILLIHHNFLVKRGNCRYHFPLQCIFQRLFVIYRISNMQVARVNQTLVYLQEQKTEHI